MLKYMLSIVLLLSINLSILADTEQINNVFDSVVKVKNSNDWGSGGCINIDDKFIYCITNHHVAGAKDNKVDVFFYKEGHESVPISGVVIWTAYLKNQPIDISVVKVPLDKLSGWKPKVINFEYDDALLSPGDTCLTIGCPSATWPKANRGHIEKISGGTYLITPTVVPGQSGSVLFNGDGTKAIGLIAWYEGGYGKAMTIPTLKKAVLGQTTSYYYNQPYNLKNQPLVPLDSDQHEAIFGGRNRTRNNNNNDCPDCKRKPRETEPKPDQKDTTPDNKPNNNGLDNIFPTYPRNPDKEFNNDNKDTPPQTKPDVPSTPNELDKYKTENDTKLNGLDSRLKKVEDQLGNIPSKDNVVTPGNLENILKPKLDAVSQDLSKKLEDYSSQIGSNIEKNTVTPDKLNNIIGTVQSDIKKLNEGSDALNKAYQEVKNNITSSEKTSEVNNTTSTIIKEVLTAQSADKTTDKALTIGGITVPWFVVALLGYWIRRHYGGATQNPFPTITPIPAKQQNQ